MSQAFKRQFHVDEDTQTHTSVRQPARSTPVATDACIIQCPSCSTRFSLPLNALDGQQDPRFHCSQCDTIFRVEQETERPVPALVETPVAAPVMDPSESWTMVDPGPSSSYTTQGEYQPPTVDSHPVPEPQIITTDEPAVTTPAPSQSRSFEIPKSINFSWSMGAPHESAQHEDVPWESDLKAFSAISSSQPSPSQSISTGIPDPVPSSSLGSISEQMSLDLNSPAKKLSSQETPFSRPRDLTKPQAQEHDPLKSSTIETFPTRKTVRKNKQAPKPAAPKSKRGEVLIQKRQLLLESVKKLRISIPLGRWQAPLMIAGPLVTFCGILFFLSIVLKTDPLHSEEMITNVVPGLPRVAPPGLAVIEARLRKLTLDSGDTIYALSGVVKNNSGKQLNQIHLDGLVFDKAGSMIKEKQVLVSSPLAQSKIKSLSLEMIEDIEANASKGKTAVKDGESAPFVVTFLPSEVSGARYFSTRINSIK